jgi:hypothetical protein
MAHQARQSWVARAAFDDSLEVFGTMGRDLILRDLEANKLYSSQIDYLEAGAIAGRLAEYLGAECATLLMSELWLKTGK